jgi:hypothetical protein
MRAAPLGRAMRAPEHVAAIGAKSRVNHSRRTAVEATAWQPPPSASGNPKPAGAHGPECVPCLHAPWVDTAHIRVRLWHRA